MRLCFGRWGLTPDCPTCPDARVCAEDFVFCRVATLAQAGPGGMPLAEVAVALDVPEDIIRAALAFVLDGVEATVPCPEAPQPPPVDERWQRLGRPGRRGRGTAGTRWERMRNPTVDLHRWNQERERHPLLRKLAPGWVIEREYAGEIHQVVVSEGWGYLYRGLRYPTLYTVMVAICGRRGYRYPARKYNQPPSTSVEVFFRIRRMLKDADRFIGRLGGG